MNTYEVLIIFKPILDIENVDAILNHFQKNIVEANQGEVVDVDRIGRKRLAFEIKRFKDGFLALYILKLPANKVVDFKRACQLNEDVLRITMLRQEEGYKREAPVREEAPMRRDGRRDDFRGGRGGDREDRPRREFVPRDRD